jgi:hypothetical protein
MVFQFLCAFSTLKCHHLPNSLPNFVFFHFFFPLYCTSWVGVEVFYLLGEISTCKRKKVISSDFNLQKKERKWFQPYEGFLTEKNDPNSPDFEEKMKSKSSDFYDKFQ